MTEKFKFVVNSGEDIGKLKGLCTERHYYSHQIPEILVLGTYFS